MEGRMKKKWAEQYSDEGFYYSKIPGKCQNPQCGRNPIFHRHIIRHNLSGDVVEVGTHCYQRWRVAIGLSSTPWFDDYLILLREESRKHEGERLSPSILKGYQEKAILRMVSKGKIKPDNIPSTVDKILQRQARKKWLLKYCKEHGFRLQPFNQPMQNFKTFDEAEEWAIEHGGYCGGALTLRGEKFWSIFINPHYNGTEY